MSLLSMLPWYYVIILRAHVSVSGVRIVSVMRFPYFQVNGFIRYKHTFCIKVNIRLIMFTCLVPTFLQRGSWWSLQTIEGPWGPCPQSWEVHLRRWEDVGSCAGRGRETEEAAAVARTTTLTSVTINGGLKLTWGAEAFPLALIWVQVFHVP